MFSQNNISCSSSPIILWAIRSEPSWNAGITKHVAAPRRQSELLFLGNFIQADVASQILVLYRIHKLSIHYWNSSVWLFWDKIEHEMWNWKVASFCLWCRWNTSYKGKELVSLWGLKFALVWNTWIGIFFFNIRGIDDPRRKPKNDCVNMKL